MNRWNPINAVEPVMMWFEIVAGKNVGQKFPLQSEGDFLRIGRCHDAAVFLDSSTIAPQHAAFIPGEGFSLTCCQADQGFRTRRNGQTASLPFQVGNGDEIQLGEFVLRFRAEQSVDVSS